jgi:hypothetical protein
MKQTSRKPHVRGMFTVANCESLPDHCQQHFEFLPCPHSVGFIGRHNNRVSGCEVEGLA